MSVPGGATGSVSDAAKFLAKRRRALFAHYPKALLGDAEAIHDLRVAVRRGRVTLSLLDVKPGGKRARRIDRRLRDLARAAGRSRDLDVGKELLERLAPASKRDGGALEALGRAFTATRSRGHAVARNALLDLDVAGLRRDLRRAAERAPVTPGVLAGRLARAADRQGAKLLERFAAAGKRYNPELLHSARRFARRLRYAAEVSEAILGHGGDAAKAWRTLQNRLGELHDRDVLEAWLARYAARTERRGLQDIARAARSARARVVRDARRLHRELLASDPAAFAAAALTSMREAAKVSEPPPSEAAPDTVVIEFPRAAS